jgi:hypothetical protein
MNTLTKRIGSVTVALGAVLVLGQTALAQRLAQVEAISARIGVLGLGQTAAQQAQAQANIQALQAQAQANAMAFQAQAQANALARQKIAAQVLQNAISLAQRGQAQSISLALIKPATPYNTNPMIAPGVSLLQYAYNTAVLGRAYSQIPPYLLGYNPYPPAAVSYGGGYGPQTFQPATYNPYSTPAYAPAASYGGGYSSYGASPYAGGYSAGGIDPLTGLPTGGGYGGGYYPYGSGADLAAYGQLGLDQEKARILREVANQAKLDTRKKLIDTLAYIRANAYTFTKEQADIAKRLLERLQKTPTQTEIQTGKSLNVMLKYLVDFKAQQMHLPTILLDEDVLKLVNISGSGGSASIGLLRDNGQFTWPAAFDDKEVIGEKDRKDLDLEVKQLYQQAATGTPDANMLRSVDASLRTLRTNLTKQVNNLPTSSYLDAQRFLDEFDGAMSALKRGDVVLNLDFQRTFVKGGKTVQELVDYLGNKGLQFAAASPGDERAYTALQAAFSAHSLAINTQVTTATGKSN